MGSRWSAARGWYEFEAPPGLHHSPYATERSRLYEAGVLGIDEAAALETEWRQAFAEAQALSSDAERRAAYAEADIPSELVKRWSAAARRRRARQPVAPSEEVAATK